MSIVWYFVALVVLIALSAFFSASEMSYSSANRLRLETPLRTAAAAPGQPSASSTTMTVP